MAAAQDESQADSDGLRAEKAQVPAYGEVGPADGEEAWYGQEGPSWYGERQPWYGQDQGWYGQDSFGPMAPQDYDVSDGQFYQPQEQQSYWAQLPQDQVNGFSGEEWYSPDQNGQMYVPDLNGQPYLPDQNGQPDSPELNGQPYLPDQNGQPYIPGQNGQPYSPDQNGQPFFPDLNGQPYMPELPEESQESDTGVLPNPMGVVDSHSNGWYTPMASAAPMMTADWNGGVEYPNQWYNVDPYGPVPSYDQVSGTLENIFCEISVKTQCSLYRTRVITCTSIITTTATAAPTWTTITTTTSCPSARRAFASRAASRISGTTRACASTTSATAGTGGWTGPTKTKKVLQQLLNVHVIHVKK